MIRLACLLAVVTIALGGCNTAYNYFEEDADASEQEGDSTAFGAILSMSGIVAKPKSPINYKPRAPLAMPGTSDLPPPEQASAAEQAVNFPVDDDDRRRQHQAELNEKGKEAAFEQNGRTTGVDGRLSPDDVIEGRRAGGGFARGDDKVLHDWRSQSFVMSREELKQGIPSMRKQNALLTDEGKAAPRKYLIQPPDDYRTPADTAALPDKGDIENSEWAKKRLYSVKDRTPARAIQQ
ncbi:hypothetical protein [Acuticoccus mangrovi]|uniref:DUF3035 domain-containing protein n=1 Tax=Acuticoccus mangrovi TaxID=2796142 RepID=A0A934INZ4_9HYPH|nr:hypothetical protein [Acuticoccus mangrovi]MBJ3775687.1 hypothetical protein [Acuticoccus mangrovi]